MPELPGLPEEVADALLVLEDASSREQYEIGSLTFTSGAGEDKVINLIPITIINGKLLVAVPLGAWHKTAGRRLLPRTVFTKAVKVEVLAVNSDEPSECLDAAPLKLQLLWAWRWGQVPSQTATSAMCRRMARRPSRMVRAWRKLQTSILLFSLRCLEFPTKTRDFWQSGCGGGGGDGSRGTAEVFGGLSGEDPGESGTSCTRPGTSSCLHFCTSECGHRSSTFSFEEWSKERQARWQSHLAAWIGPGSCEFGKSCWHSRRTTAEPV